MESEFWQLLLAAEMSPEKGRALIEALGPTLDIRQDELAAHSLLTKNEAARIRSCNLDAVRNALGSGVELVAADTYPARLAGLDDAPIAFFSHGNAQCLDGPCLGIVGTRNASAYGKGVARRFAESLAAAGATIVSGGAIGIDAAAHEGALNAEGQTVAVLAGGIDKPYPSRNIGLFRRIRESGCLVSAYACGTLPEPYKFLERNVLIAGLCDAILVVEAPSRSGALSTAIAARKFGRPVFAVPANIEIESFKGSHELIRTGAMLVDAPAQIGEALGLLMMSAPKLEPATGLAAKILLAMTTTPLAAEKLAESLNLQPQQLMEELTMLELDGRVTRELGGYALVP